MNLTEIETARLSEIAERWADSTTGHWVIVTDKTKVGEDWLVGFGNSAIDGMDYYITTNRVHASELDGDAKIDAELVVNAKKDIEFMGKLIDRLLKAGQP